MQLRMPLTFCLFACAAVSPSLAQCLPTWTRVATAGPTEINGGTASFDGQHVILYGGMDCTGTRLADTWSWDGSTWTQLAVVGPPARAGHALAYDSARQRVVLNGGFYVSSGITHLYDDTWEWDGSTWTVRRFGNGGGMCYHSMAYDAAHHNVVRYGGQDQNGLPLGGTWIWDGNNWVASNTVSPSARTKTSMAYDPNRGIILFGGDVGCGAEFRDTWLFNGVSWSQISTTGPAIRSNSGLAYSAGRGKVILFGGSHCTIPPINPPVNYGDTWELTGNTWMQLSMPGPGTPLCNKAMTFDSLHDEIVMYSGPQTAGSCPAHDTWVFRPPCRADFNCDGSLDFFDYLDFVDAFSSNLPTADFNHDNTIDFFDYLDFVDAFSAGC